MEPEGRSVHQRQEEKQADLRPSQSGHGGRPESSQKSSKAEKTPKLARVMSTIKCSKESERAIWSVGQHFLIRKLKAHVWDGLLGRLHLHFTQPKGTGRAGCGEEPLGPFKALKS